MAAKKVKSMEADLEKYLEEVKGKFVALGNKLDSKVKALKKKQELEDKRYEEVKNMLLSLTNKDTSYARPVKPLKRVQIGLKIDDLGFLIPPTNTRTSADGGQKRSEKNGVRNTIRTSSGTRANHIEGRFFNHGYDHRMRKIKMPLFDGEDAHGWIYKEERYFESEARAPFRSWEEQKRRFLDRFQPSQEGNLHEQFLSITQDGSAREYVSLFEQIAAQLRGVSGGYGRNLYQRCDEKFRHGHRCPGKTLQVLLVGDEYKTEHEFDKKSDDHVHLDMVEVSLNFVMGFTSPHTMKIQGIIGDEEVVVLIDSGVTHNFLSKRVLKELGLLVMGGLPPHRDHEHVIVLKEGTTPISVRPYRDPPRIIPYEVSSTPTFKVDHYLQERDTILEELRKNLLKVQQTMKSKADRHRKEENFKVSQLKRVIGSEVAESVLPEGLAEDMEVILQPEVLGIREGSNSAQGSREALICLKNLPGYEATW
nr:ankyrin repeat-containing protein [Tanacetum cinerariifolium]